MSILLSCNSLTKSFGARPLFQGINLGIDESERLGIIGPNGSGKTTLLRILAGLETPDTGTVSMRRGLHLAYVAQEEAFAPDVTVEQVLAAALAGKAMDEIELSVSVEVMLSRIGFADRDQPAASLSGGWRKRLAIARALITEPELLIMDEPTNHLDLEGVLWLEEMLNSAPFALMVVSHDRYFLENVTNRMIDLNPAYAEGFLNVVGNYSEFLVRREEYLNAQATREQTLANQVKKEVEWLRRGPPARTTKAQYRIDEAHRMIGELGETRFRNNQNQAAGIDFRTSGRKTRELLTGRHLSKTLGGKLLFSDLEVDLSPGVRLGLLGPNGSGKSTLLKILTGALEPDAGVVKRADGLRVVYFDQSREQLNRKVSLRDALSPNSDTVVFQGAPMHVTGWAKRFLFRTEQLNQPVERLSGGEQARVLIARLMLAPSDILILDEPTNDLDIPTLEVLEQSLSTFPGALILVTHDRFLLDQVSTDILALDSAGHASYYSGYRQWEANKDNAAVRNPAPASKPAAPRRTPGGGLSKAERKELGQLEEKLNSAEQEVERLKQMMQEPAVASNHARLQETWESVQKAEAWVLELYGRWEVLEQKDAAG